MSANTRQIKVIELFAGVGGFRLGLQRASPKFKVVWSNQWEPATKSQHASDIYVKRFGSEGHTNQNIATVATEEIPEHDMLVGGFPCQDYSVAGTLKYTKGLEGKKGVLWWEIYRILNEKEQQPKFLLLENVDRLLKSPVKQRGRDFAIMLASLADLGYIVEWRVINAADYGMPQRRRRIFFLSYHSSSKVHAHVLKLKDPITWVLKEGVFAEAFPVQTAAKEKPKHFKITGDVVDVSNEFNKQQGAAVSPFENSGIMIGRDVYTINTTPSYDGPFETLGSKILPNDAVPQEYYIDEDSLDKWSYLKGAKSEKRVNSTSGFEYQYSEGSMVFPDPLDKPSRTIITGEGGAAPSRFKHVIRTADGRLRRLTPLELERLNMFPDGHTEGTTAIKRAFFMGNALVVGIIERTGRVLAQRI